MAILASGHKLVRCGIDGAISGVVTDETLSGNGTSGEPLGALLENVIFDDSITESSTDLGTIIGVNPLWVNYVVTGGGSSGGDPHVNYIVNTYSGAWNDTTDVVQSNSAQWAEGGSGDIEVNSYVYDNSATINEVNTTFQNNSGNYLTAHQDISNKLNTTAFTAWSAAQAENAFKLSAGNGVNLIDDAINKITRIDVTASGNAQVNTYVQNNSAGINNAISTYETNSGKYLTAHQNIDSKLDVTAFDYWSARNAYDISAGNGIGLYIDNVNRITRIDVTAAGGDSEVNTYVQNNSATINNVNTTYQTNSGNYLTAHQDISNKLDITTFTSWSAAQEASDYELSAGNGVTLYDDAVNKITRIDVTAAGGDEEVNTLVHSNSSTWNDVTNKLDKSESANYYPMTGNPSKFIPQSALNLKINKISGIGGSALSVGNHNAVTFPLSDGFGGIDIGIPYDNGYLQYLSTDHISEVTLTTMPKVGNYKISANSAEYIIPGNSWITFYEQRNSEGQYRWTIKDYNGSGVLTSATSTTTGGGAGNGCNFRTIYSKNEGQNTAVLGYYYLDVEATDIQGIVQFVPNGRGTFALCPFTAENNNAYYTKLGYQTTNSPTVNSGDLVTLPFHFYADGQYICPTTLGIKGSNSTATITPYNIIINYK